MRILERLMALYYDSKTHNMYEMMTDICLTTEAINQHIIDWVRI